MAKQKCGSCHYFQESDLPGSGWCHHPQRKVSSDVKILVRRNELACRDEWSRSLWQPSSGESDATRFEQPAGHGPVPPATPAHLRAFLDRDAAMRSGEGEDVLLSEGRIVAEDHEPWEPPPRPAAVGNFDPRTAIFRAREAHRERIRAKAAAARQSAGIEAIATDRTAEAPLEERVEAIADRGRIQAYGSEPNARAHVNSGEQSLTTPPVPSPSAVGVSEVATVAVRDDLGPEANGTTGSVERRVLASDARADLSEAKRDEVCVPDVLAGPDAEDEVVGEPGTVVQAGDLPGWFRTDLPRVCRTCRDFRPAADGQRGWCANAWAFTHRQLVQDDDVAPCHSAIGDWWAPVDDVWLVAADVSSHGRATPLLDRLVAGDSARRRRS